MKITATILVAVTLAVFSGCGGVEAKTQVSVKTIQCGMCQKTIEQGLSKVRGVKNTRVSLDDKMTHVTHDPQVIDLAGIEEEISKLGYQANETPADPAAYEALPGCCKVGGGH
ncbi:MAG: heavy-metal-associated domain-containing protein [Candidatus Neomarinimicrobiota bacterium]|nr:heavy-metal-associated domain-containing protein [Candidatus Neomarinimicrobiota bacterium]